MLLAVVPRHASNEKPDVFNFLVRLRNMDNPADGTMENTGFGNEVLGTDAVDTVGSQE